MKEMLTRAYACLEGKGVPRDKWLAATWRHRADEGSHDAEGLRAAEEVRRMMTAD